MTRKTNKLKFWNKPFNSPFESGLRSLIILTEAYPEAFDSQRLLYYSYMIVHTADISGGPESIHPLTPHRSGELLVRREIVKNGILLMQLKGLLEQQNHEDGIFYKATDFSVPFLDSISSSYFDSLRERAAWVVQIFSEYSDKSLRGFIQDHLDKWGAEFEHESLVREVPE